MCAARPRRHRRPPLGVALVLYSSIIITVVAFKKPTLCDPGAAASSLLWRVARRRPPAYLFGTVHAAASRVWPRVPTVAKRAFAAAQRLFLELDLTDERTAAALDDCQHLPQGQNLSSLLPAELFASLRGRLEWVRASLPRWLPGGERLFAALAGDWERRRPVWALLLVLSLTEGELRAGGEPVLDLYLAQEAGRLSKRTAAVERVEEQCRPLNGLDLRQVVFALNRTLQRRGSTAGPDELVRRYNCGQLDAGDAARPLASLAGGPLTAEEAALATGLDHYFRQELVYNRNLRMGLRVAQLLRQHSRQSLFFALGAGHFLGNDSILDFVQAQGFQLEHVPMTAEIPKRDTLVETGPQHAFHSWQPSGTSLSCASFNTNLRYMALLCWSEIALIVIRRRLTVLAI